jgi:hypothetical protein
VRTLVVSDLHLGGGSRAWLRRPEAAQRLAEAIAGIERLVLLGDVVELRHCSARDAMRAAGEVLPGLIARLPAGGEIVVVPGNHDHALGLSWALRRSVADGSAPLALEERIDWLPGEPMAVLAGLLEGSGAQVRAAYPGVWLREDVYAHHGHYLDRHTTVPFFERLGAGAMAKLLRTPVGEAATVNEYENVLAPIYGWMYPISQGEGPAVDGSEGPSARAWRQLRFGRGPRKWLLAAGAGALIAGLNRTSLGPLSASVLRGSLEGAELPAFAAVLDALGVERGWAIFGHTHRAGPLPGDAADAWRTAAGVRMINSGSWVFDELFIDPRRARQSPYRPGFAVRIEDDRDPQLVNLLD